MFVVAAAGLTQSYAAVTLADTTLREDEDTGGKIFHGKVKIIFILMFS
jgi:hypothetical protein